MKKYLDIINSELEIILIDIEHEILDDPTISEFTTNKNALYQSILQQTDILTDYLEDFHSDKFNTQLYTDFYENLNIPYTIIYRTLNSLKTKMIKTLDINGIEKLEIYQFSQYFQKFLDQIAKIYIKKELKSLKDILNSPFKQYLLFNSHINWLSKIVQSIEKDDMTIFPITTHKSCEFSKVLMYPESLMVCIDKNLCVYLEDLHKIIHKMADSFYVFYNSKQFSEAYFVFKDLKEQILKFKQLISELYFVTYSNIEFNFFKLVEMLEYSQDLYLTMIDIKNLKNLNKIYGEQTITSALLQLETEIKNHINNLEQNLLIKGLTSDFYLLNIHYTQKEHQNFIQDLNNYIKNTTLKIDDLEINFEALLITIKIDKFSELKDSEIIKIFSYIKKESKSQNTNIIYKPNINDIVKIILTETIDEKFIYTKTNNGDIDVMFQPIYDIKTNKIFTLEALGRISHENRLIPAGAFINKIYEMNLITQFDTKILDKLIEKKPLLSKITPRIFLNISFQSLLNDKYLDKLNQLFKTFDDIEIILELTEQKFVENYEMIEKINQEHNIFFAVDDFGSGYSSLKSLAELVKKGILKILKIDGSLIQDILEDNYDKKIVKIISQLGKELELLTVAEYIENENVLKTIDNLKINLAQGYYLSKPKTIEELILDLNN